MGIVQNILVVGAGLAGSVVARELAERGYQVAVIDKRDHVGGNCYDYISNGVRVHKYGPHIFHTNNKKVIDWLSNFTGWVDYKHKVKAYHNGTFLTLPPNKQTQQALGDNLFNVIYLPYTKKMWGTLDIDNSVLNRVKVREDDNQYYFPDCQYQYLPSEGYTSMFNNILNHPNITVSLGIEFDKQMETRYQKIFSSMPIDHYYDYCYGELPYRSIKFHNVTSNSFEMPTSVVNFTDDNKFTRITKWELFPNHGQGELYTLEEPCDYKDNNMERYYPVKDVAGVNRSVYNRYKNIINDKVVFIGRCGMYTYIDMDMAVSSALSTTKEFLNNG